MTQLDTTRTSGANLLAGADLSTSPVVAAAAASASVAAQVKAVREKHGFTGGKTQYWSKNNIPDFLHETLAANEDPHQRVPGQILIEDGKNGEIVEVTEIGEHTRAYPKNARLLNYLQERFALFGFRWKALVRMAGKGKGRRKRAIVEYENYPAIGKVSPTLKDLQVQPLPLFDQYANQTALLGVPIGEPAGPKFAEQMARQNNTGIGYKGFDKVSWHSMLAPFVFPVALQHQLQNLADALFAFFDAVSAVNGTDLDTGGELAAMLHHKRPEHIPGMETDEPMLFIRPDIVVQADPDSPSGFTPVITELESCPAGHGMMHSMQIGFNMDPEMVDRFVEFLDGRPYVVVATSEWSEYLWDQGVFIAELRKRGVDARIVFDATLEAIHEDVQTRWTLPKKSPQHMRDMWSTDFLGRIKARGWSDFIYGLDDLSEFTVADSSVLFRFGYFDNISMAHLKWLENLVENHGCTLMNPNNFFLESKGLMAALGNKAIRDWLESNRPGTLAILDRCISTTRVLDPRYCDIDALCGDDKDTVLCRPFALTKFGAWDGKNMSWGSRSLDVGAQFTGPGWEKSVKERLQMPHPVVAQHVIKSSVHQVVYVDGDGKLQVMKGARTRLTPFFLRSGVGEQAQMCGHMLTLRAGSLRIHGATDSVEVPCVFMDDDEACNK